MDLLALVGVVAIFGLIPISLIWGIYNIVKAVQQRRTAEAYARQGMIAPPENKMPKKVGDVVLVRGLALVGVALGLGLGEIWYNDILSIALVIGFGGLGMLAGWLIIRAQDKRSESK